MLPYPTDPALPSNPNPYFQDDGFVRGDQQRANNAQIWADLLDLDDRVVILEDYEQAEGTLTGRALGAGTGPVTALTPAQALAILGLPHTLLAVPSWNMDTTQDMTIAHGLTRSKIVMVAAIIRNDADTNSYQFYAADFKFGVDSPDGWISDINNTNVVLTRLGGGRYDTNPDFDGTGFNRGKLVIWSTP